MSDSRYLRKRSLAGVIAAMAVVNLVYGITFPLLALVLDGQGVSKTLIGLNTIVQALAVIVIAPWAPGLLLPKPSVALQAGRHKPPSRRPWLRAQAAPGPLLVPWLQPRAQTKEAWH